MIEDSPERARLKTGSLISPNVVRPTIKYRFYLLTPHFSLSTDQPRLPLPESCPLEGAFNLACIDLSA